MWGVDHLGNTEEAESLLFSREEIYCGIIIFPRSCYWNRSCSALPYEVLDRRGYYAGEF